MIITLHQDLTIFQTLYGLMEQNLTVHFLSVLHIAVHAFVTLLLLK